MQASQRLTKRVVDAAEPNADKAYCIWDSDVKGFRLRVRPSGRKTFELKYRAGRRQRLFVIGDYGPFTAEKARKAAEDAKHNASRGGDPQHEKVVHRNAATVAELIQLYLTEGRIDKPNKRESSWECDKRDLLLHVHPILGATPINALKTPDIQRWQRDVAAFKTARVKKLGFRKLSCTRGGPKVVGRATRTLSAMLNWAIKRELIKDNPAARVSKPADVMRERFLSDEEAVHLFTTLDEMETLAEIRPDHADLFRIIALTGSRLAEMRDLAWSEVDFSRPAVVLAPERHKTGQGGRRKVINLNGAAVEILKRRANKTDWVFPKPAPYHGPMETPRHAWRAVLKRAKFDDLRIHDLRHTFASLLIKDGHSLAFVQKALGHSRPEVTARYAHLKDEATRAAFDHVGAIYTGAKKAEPHEPAPSQPGAGPVGDHAQAL
jgi:integrase